MIAQQRRVSLLKGIDVYKRQPLHTAERVDHIREPAQFRGKALPQLRWIFIAFADVEKAASAVNGDIHPAVCLLYTSRCV